MSTNNMNEMAPAAENSEHPADKKYVGYRLLSLLVLVLSVAAFFLPMFKGLDSNNAVVSSKLLDTLLGSFKSGNKLFNALPIMTPNTMLGGIYGVSVYLCVLALVIAAFTALGAVFSKAKAPRRTKVALFFLVFGAFAYALALMVVSTSNSADGKSTFDVVTFALTAVGVFFYFILVLVKIKKAVWINVFQGLLTFTYVVVLALAIAKDQLLSQQGTAKILCAVAFVWLFVTALVAIVRFAAESGWVKNLVRHIISLIMALVVCYAVFSLKDAVQNPQYILIILSALLAIAQIVIDVILIKNANKKEVEDAKEEAMQGFHTEEYAEAYAYEGGPVAGVLMAEEINPSFLPHPPHVNTAGYDFYNCKSFDPFIATLNMEERNAFTELFILKFKGTFPEIPDYVVGGDNKEFFRKIFIYLGQYRDRIPSDLLGKMYQFSLRAM